MKRLISLHDTFFETFGPAVLSTMARLTFLGVLLAYFWASALTKLGPSLLTPADGAYIQVFPRVVEALEYDFSGFAWYHTAIVLLGTAAEFLLPLLIVIGLATRLAALGMILFILIQSVTDVVGHGIGGEDLGRWFDAVPSALILDQRALWVLLLAVLVCCGAGPLSLDRLLSRARTA